jgi:hypothetical protein
MSNVNESILELELKGHKIQSENVDNIKTFIPLDTPDIIDVNILVKSPNNDTYITYNPPKNQIKITKNEDKGVFLYHSFDDIDFWGRWYNCDYQMNNISNKLIVNFDGDWVDFDTNKLTSAVITITLSDQAVNKIRKFVGI